MSFREFLTEATITKHFNDVGTAVAKKFTAEESKQIIKVLKKLKGLTSIVRSMESDEDYSEDLLVELDDGTKFTLYARDGVLRMGAGNSKTSKPYEVKAVTAKQLIEELPTASIQ